MTPRPREHVAVELVRQGAADIAREVCRQLRPWAVARLLGSTAAPAREEHGR